MESSGSSRSGLLTAGGVLSIIGGLLELVGGGAVIGVGIMGIGGPVWFIPEIPWFPGREIVLGAIPAVIIIVGIVIVALGAIGVAGGVSALGRKSFGLSLAGAICTVIPTFILGILAIIFVSVSKREFGAKTREVSEVS
jgi:hypothetical protein